jgi:isocitrate/isopropylmalate dehydrogenase
MVFNVVVLAGDGIGPEVMSKALKVLKAIGQKFQVGFELLPRQLNIAEIVIP